MRTALARYEFNDDDLETFSSQFSLFCFIFSKTFYLRIYFCARFDYVNKENTRRQDRRIRIDSHDGNKIQFETHFHIFLPKNPSILVKHNFNRQIKLLNKK